MKRIPKLNLRQYKSLGCFLYCLVVTALQPAHALDFQDCDLIFCIQGESEMSKAIGESTATGGLSFDHVGIIEIDDHGEVFVIEASTQEGVRETPLSLFLERAKMPDGTEGVMVRRLAFPFNKESVVMRAKGFLGQPYDWWYLPDNGKIYCSELVYESFRDEEGHPIFDSKPMNFRSPDGTMPEFWVKLYAKLGREVPEGIQGTNPNDLFKDSRLITVE